MFGNANTGYDDVGRDTLDYLSDICGIVLVVKGIFCLLLWLGKYTCCPSCVQVLPMPRVHFLTLINNMPGNVCVAAGGGVHRRGTRSHAPVSFLRYVVHPALWVKVANSTTNYQIGCDFYC